MSSRCQTFFLGFTLLAIAVVSGCMEKKTSLSGIYKTSHDSGIIAPLNEGEECKPPYKEEEFGCIEPYTGVNVMGLHETENKDLDFALSLDFFNGHSCSIEDVAKKDNTGWTYLEKGEGEYSDQFCKVTFSIVDGNVVIHADGDICSAYCGARGRLDGTTFPLASKTTTVINTKEQLDCVLSQDQPCEGQATPEVNE